jgi:serine/threonine protein phosphatase 1
MAFSMRILAIGDIHGCSRALDRLLAAVSPQPADRVITLGDYVDRGPDSYRVLERLLRLRRRCRLIPLRGNHELMMLDARKGRAREKEWLRSGGYNTLASYSLLDEPGRLVDVPDHHWEFMERTCRDWYETDTHFFVHANAYADLALEEQPASMLYWEPFNDPGPHCSGKTMVCGHTPQQSGVPRSLGHAVCIDTWAFGHGWLTCLDVKTGRVWQANQAGRERMTWLDDCIADV